MFGFGYGSDYNGSVRFELFSFFIASGF